MSDAELDSLTVQQPDVAIAPEQDDDLDGYLDQIETAVADSTVGEVKRVAGQQVDWETTTGGKIPDQVL